MKLSAPQVDFCRLGPSAKDQACRAGLMQATGGSTPFHSWYPCHRQGSVSGRGSPQIPRVFVASLAEYSVGRIQGGWVEICGGVPSVTRQLQSRLRTPDREDDEWIVLDYEGFGSFPVPEYIDVPSLVAIGEGISEHGPAFAAFLTISNGETVDVTQGFEDSYLGHWDDPCDYAEEWAVDSGFSEDLLPEHLRKYVRLDLEVLVDDLERDVSFVPAPDGGVYAFARRAEV